MEPVTQPASSDSRKVDGRGNIFRGPDAPDGVKGVKSLFQGLRDPVFRDKSAVDRCFNDCGRDRIDANALIAELHRKVLRECMQASLRHRIG